MKQKLLLHVCCAPCSTHVIEALQEGYELTLFFYNPNIEPMNEYILRTEQAEKYAGRIDMPIAVGDYDNIDWRNSVKGHETEPEGGERCSICCRFRLEKTAQLAKEKGFDIFTTTLTVSPYKDAPAINSIGKDLENKYGVKFLESDFKSNGGYTHSIEMSKRNYLYRQNYCGCLFAKR